MAEGVTYADLRFAQSPPEEKGRPPTGQDAHEEASDGELTYENCPAAATRPRGPTPASAEPPPQAPGPARRRLWSRVPLALLGACLFLLAAGLGLGIRYWQVSRQLEGASQRHRAERSALGQRISSQEENLTHFLGQLSQAQADLSTTWRALWQSWQAGNSTQQKLEGLLEQAQSSLGLLQQEKDKVSRELEEQRERWTVAHNLLQQEKDKAMQELEKVRSCQQMGPHGWMLFQWKCLWVSSEKETWEGSRQACESRGAQLLMLKAWDAGTTWDTTAVMSHLQSEEFWVGLRTVSVSNRYYWEWQWVDGARYTGWGLYSDNYNCAQVSQGTLRKAGCYSYKKYVCEKVAVPSQ